MSRSWNVLSQHSNGLYAPADFERAAYRLVTEQVLYASDRGSRSAYHLVEAYFAEFAAVLAPLGVRLERNAHYRYVVALPARAEGVPVTLDETLLLLVLRQRYDEAARRGDIEEFGEVVVELPELQEAYRRLVGRPMPEVGTLRTLARTARRWGVARLVESDADDPQPFHLRVRPAIVDIVGETWLQRLDQHNRDDVAEEAVTEDDDAAA
ncbi:DUF4194 domain-containing protein [Arenimonas composti]|uniref:DUF4194 domain-containing protein n=1 Tax=Arenimonas composti TR7-09 = DSM 18010 TaxID=1121013 RepID=A0A091B358_9GAMM|nr:DUF4194 domain-containing protein [Arenimonas composti]KFN45309.1 hypothetical protein P873_02480 [Arenimonas composti TR7-09 = DSM 18010]